MLVPVRLGKRSNVDIVAAALTHQLYTLFCGVNSCTNGLLLRALDVRLLRDAKVSRSFDRDVQIADNRSPRPNALHANCNSIGTTSCDKSNIF